MHDENHALYVCVWVCVVCMCAASLCASHAQANQSVNLAVRGARRYVRLKALLLCRAFTCRRGENGKKERKKERKKKEKRKKEWKQGNWKLRPKSEVFTGSCFYQ